MKKTESVLVTVALILVLAVFVWMLVGCNPTKKAFDRVQRTENRLALAEICAEKFPVKDSVIEKEVIIFDTIYAGEVIFDTLRYRDTVRITKTLPAKVITKTVEKVVEKWRENTAKVIDLEGKLSAANAKLAKASDDLRIQYEKAKHYKGQRNKAYLWWLILVGLCVGYLFRGKIFSLIKKAI